MKTKYTYTWQPFAGEYEKMFYDIKTRDGRILKVCWPNAGKFHQLKSNDNDIDAVDVAMIRISK